MPITGAEIQFRYSGGPGASSGATSLGGQMSTTAWAGGVLHDLFDAVTGDENAANDVEYRCVYIRNSNATLTWGSGPSIKVWLTGVVAGGADIAIGLATQGVGNGTSTGVASTIANENTAPSPAVTFTAPTDKASSTVAPAEVPAGSGFALWIRRTATNSPAASNDGATINVEGDTPA